MKSETAEGICELVGALEAGTPREIREAQRYLRIDRAAVQRRQEEEKEAVAKKSEHAREGQETERALVEARPLLIADLSGLPRKKKWGENDRLLRGVVAPPGRFLLLWLGRTQKTKKDSSWTLLGDRSY